MPTFYDDLYDDRYPDPRDEADLWDRSLVDTMDARESLEQQLWNVAPRDAIDYVNCAEREFFYDHCHVEQLIQHCTGLDIVHVTITPMHDKGRNMYDLRSYYAKRYSAVITHTGGCFAETLR